MTAILTLDDINIKHYFGHKEYIKEAYIPAGVELEQHKHKHSHLSVLMKGRAAVTVEGVTAIYDAPKILEIGALKAHKIGAITDVIWLCVWGIDPSLRDSKTIDDGLIA